MSLLLFDSFANLMLFNRIFRIANYSNESSSYSQVWQSTSVISALTKKKLRKLGFEASLGQEGDLCSLVVSKIFFFVFSLFGILSYYFYSLSLIIIICVHACVRICSQFLYVDLTVLAFAVQTRLALNWQRSICLCLHGVRIKGMHHHSCPQFVSFKWHSIQNSKNFSNHPVQNLSWYHCACAS